MEKLNELVELAEKADAFANLMDSINPHTILAIAEAFQALELENALLKQGCENNPLVHEMLDWKERAEAAEAKLKEAQENLGFWGRVAAKETIRANKAEEKLADLEKQGPVGWMTDVEVDELHSGVAEEAYIYAHADATSTIPLFTRPAPAINISELVPDEAPEGIADKMEEAVGIFLDKEDCQYLYSVCRTAILRKIEEVK